MERSDTLIKESARSAFSQIPAFYFDQAIMDKLGEELAPRFQNAQPFPHIVIDNLIPPDILDIVESEFPGPEHPGWNVYGPGPVTHTNNRMIEKLGCPDDWHYGQFTRHFMAQFYSYAFLRFLERMTGFNHIIVDPSYNGCGLHSTGPGGRLVVHADQNRHPNQDKLDQCLNLILFVNKDWKDEYGGHLELWSRDAKRCEKKVLPVFNRMVIFDTDNSSYHGHPHPLSCPPDRRRNSLAVYYYVIDRPKNENYYQNPDYVTWRLNAK